jgi:hypothetical protein
MYTSGEGEKGLKGSSMKVVSALKRALYQPIRLSSATLFSVAGLIFLAAAVYVPGDPDFIRLASALLTMGAVLQRRDAGLWPFSVPRVETFVDTIFLPVLKIAFLSVRLLFWVGVVIAGLFAGLLLIAWFASFFGF